MALGAADDRTRSAMLAAGAVVVAALSGCVEQRAGPAPPGQAARLPGEGFFFDQEGGEAKLA
jgi:hypothetical protein